MCVSLKDITKKKDTKTQIERSLHEGQDDDPIYYNPSLSAKHSIIHPTLNHFPNKNNNKELPHLKLLSRIIPHPHQCSLRIMTNLSLDVLKQFYHPTQNNRKNRIYPNPRPFIFILKLEL